MAVSTKRMKGSKDGEKKQAKKMEEEVFRTEERKEELVTEVHLASPLLDNQIITSSASPPPSAPEPVYEEPVLTPLIVSRFADNNNFVPLLSRLQRHTESSTDPPAKATQSHPPASRQGRPLTRGGRGDKASGYVLNYASGLRLRCMYP